MVSNANNSEMVPISFFKELQLFKNFQSGHDVNKIFITLIYVQKNMQFKSKILKARYPKPVQSLSTG